MALAILTCRVLHLNGLFHRVTHQRQRQVAALHLMEELMASEIHFPFSPLSIHIQMTMQSKYYMLSILTQFTVSLWTACVDFCEFYYMVHTWYNISYSFLLGNITSHLTPKTKGRRMPPVVILEFVTFWNQCSLCLCFSVQLPSHIICSDTDRFNRCFL